MFLFPQEGKGAELPTGESLRDQEGSGNSSPFSPMLTAASRSAPCCSLPLHTHRLPSPPSSSSGSSHRRKAVPTGPSWFSQGSHSPATLQTSCPSPTAPTEAGGQGHLNTTPKVTSTAGLHHAGSLAAGEASPGQRFGARGSLTPGRGSPRPSLCPLHPTLELGGALIHLP